MDYIELHSLLHKSASNIDEMLLILKELDKLSVPKKIPRIKRALSKTNERTLANLLFFIDSGHISKDYIVEYHSHLLTCYEIRSIYGNNITSHVQDIIDIKTDPKNIWKLKDKYPRYRTEYLYVLFLHLIPHDMVTEVLVRAGDDIIDNIEAYLVNSSRRCQTLPKDLLYYFLKYDLSYQGLYAMLDLPNLEHCIENTIKFMLPANRFMPGSQYCIDKPTFQIFFKNEFGWNFDPLNICNTWEELHSVLNIYNSGNVKYRVHILNGSRYVKLKQ